MIESLYRHYCSQVALGNPLYPLPGMELKRIHFVVVLSLEGVVVDIEECEGSCSVIRSRERTGKDACDKPNYMWDSLAYITTPQFRELVRQIATTHPQNQTFRAVDNLYRRSLESLEEHPLWQKVASKRGHNLTFRLLGEPLLAAQQPELVKPPTPKIALSHPKVYISGAAGTGAKLVSYGKSLGYESYNLKAGENCSVPLDIAEGYAAAITALRQMGGEGNIVIGAVTFLHFERVVIALVPNVARISVRLFLTDCDTERLTNSELISSLMLLAPYNDPKRLSPQFIVDFVEATLLDKPLPRQTLGMLLKVKIFHTTHIAMLHRYLNIKNMSLDSESTNVGYLLGRMLAIVERAQLTAQPNVSFTIKDQLYTPLSVTPAAIYGRLSSLSSSYFRRISQVGTLIYLRGMISEVTSKIRADALPQRLSLEDQGHFALGYQHQKRLFYIKKEDR